MAIHSQNLLLQRPTHGFSRNATIVSPSDSSRMIARKFPCGNCTSVFSRKGGLTYHQKFECGQKPRFNCPYCNYCARHISNARRHVRKCHPGREVYTVDLCQLQQHVAWDYVRLRFENSRTKGYGERKKKLGKKPGIVKCESIRRDERDERMHSQMKFSLWFYNILVLDIVVVIVGIVGIVGIVVVVS